MNTDYIRGFSKTASAYGIGPDILIKFASGNFCKSAKDILSRISNAYDDIDPSVRRALIGAAGGGLASLLFQSGEDGKDKLKKALLMSALGGLGTYAADRSGAWNSLVDKLHKNARI